MNKVSKNILQYPFLWLMTLLAVSFLTVVFFIAQNQESEFNKIKKQGLLYDVQPVETIVYDFECENISPFDINNISLDTAFLGSRSYKISENDEYSKNLNISMASLIDHKNITSVEVFFYVLSDTPLENNFLVFFFHDLKSGTNIYRSQNFQYGIEHVGKWKKIAYRFNLNDQIIKNLDQSFLNLYVYNANKSVCYLDNLTIQTYRRSPSLEESIEVFLDDFEINTASNTYQIFGRRDEKMLCFYSEIEYSESKVFSPSEVKQFNLLKKVTLDGDIKFENTPSSLAYICVILDEADSLLYYTGVDIEAQHTGWNQFHLEIDIPSEVLLKKSKMKLYFWNKNHQVLLIDNIKTRLIKRAI